MHTQKLQKAQKVQKTPKAQKRNQAKVQNADKRTKVKNALKKHLRGKKVTYSLICVFVLFVHTKKREQQKENRKKRKVPTR